MRPAEQAKAEGLKSLSEVSEMTGVSLQTLGNWAKNRPALFRIVLAGCKSMEKQNMSAEKTTAVIIRNGVAMAQTKTAAGNGERVHYGWDTINNGKAIHEIGTGKISRAKKWLDDDELMEALGSAHVNYGGGEPV